MHRYKFIFFIAGLFFLLGAFNVQAASNLSGRILLQVQDRGQAWYVSPTNSQRQEINSNDESFRNLIKLGLGVSNRDFLAIQKSAPSRLLGRILIKVEDKGQAYYLNPVDKKLYALRQASDLVDLIKKFGLGITNANLAKIKTAGTTTTSPVITRGQKTITYYWTYRNKKYSLTENLSVDLYQQYANSPKVYTYSEKNPPANPRDNYYAMLISEKNNDPSINKLLNDLKTIAAQEGFQGDELVEFVLAFVQYIPYDEVKLTTTSRLVNYPFETLYKQSGVCSDKSFLSALLLRKLGYGAILFDLPEANHTAIGIQCPIADSTYGSGYCYVETTNYFPIGIIPQSLNSGIANGESAIEDVFKTTNLGKVEYYQKTSGKVYLGISATKEKVTTIKNLKNTIDKSAQELISLKKEINSAKTNLNNLKSQLDNYQAAGDWQNYNSFVPTYNAEVIKYNNQIDNYQKRLDAYNSNIDQYNQAQKNLFQN